MVNGCLAGAAKQSLVNTWLREARTAIFNSVPCGSQVASGALWSQAVIAIDASRARATSGFANKDSLRTGALQTTPQESIGRKRAQFMQEYKVFFRTLTNIAVLVSMW